MAKFEAKPVDKFFSNWNGENDEFILALMPKKADGGEPLPGETYQQWEKVEQNPTARRDKVPAFLQMHETAACSTIILWRLGQRSIINAKTRTWTYKEFLGGLYYGWQKRNSAFSKYAAIFASVSELQTEPSKHLKNLGFTSLGMFKQKKNKEAYNLDKYPDIEYFIISVPEFKSSLRNEILLEYPELFL